MTMNAGIVILQDGTPCIAYDGALPHAIHHVAFSHENYQLTLVYDDAADGSYTFEFPLDHRFVALLKDKGEVAVSAIGKGNMLDIQMYPVIFD